MIKNTHFPIWKMLVLVCIFYLPAPVYAVTYYVSSGGSDANSGLTAATAWKSISKVNSKRFLAGDSILFKRGDVWRNEALRVSSSGSRDRHIVYAAYGTGARPAILGSKLISSWSNVSGQIWASNTSIPENPRRIDTGAQIFFREAGEKVSWGYFKEYDGAFSNLIDEYDWTWNGDTVYIYSPTDPHSRYRGVEAPQMQIAVFLRDHNYITFDSLMIRFLVNTGLYDQYQTIPLRDLQVTNCDIGYIGIKNSDSAYGLSVHRSHTYIGHNVIHDCGRRAISLTMYNTAAITVEDVVIEHNHFYNGYHTTGVDCINAGPHIIRDLTIRKNLFEGDPNVDLQAKDASQSNHIFIDDQAAGGSLGDIKIYNNIFTYAHGSAVKIGNVGNVSIFHNTFYNFNITIDNYQAQIYTYATPEPISIKNNIFYNNAPGNRLTCIKIDAGDRDRFEIDHNLYYHTGPDKRLFWQNGGTNYNAAAWDEYTAETGFDTNSPVPSDPLFAGPPENFRLDADSPARGAGTIIDDIDSDYFGNSMNVPPDLGAVQYFETGAVKKEKNDMPGTGILQVFPNPFNTTSCLIFYLPHPGFVDIKIFDIRGRECGNVLNRWLGRGQHRVVIDGRRYRSGVYFIRTAAGRRSSVQKFTLVK